jgi:hypothetical protein
MKVLINTLEQTLTLYGSFHYDQFAAFYLTLPLEWRDFSFIVSEDNLEALLTGPKQIEQSSYPVQRYEDQLGCGCGKAITCDC